MRNTRRFYPFSGSSLAVGGGLLLSLLTMPLHAQLSAPGLLQALGDSGQQAREPIVVPGIPGLPALPLPALPVALDPVVVGNPGLPLLPDPILAFNPDDLPSELRVPDPLLIVDPDNLPDPLLPGLPALPDLPASGASGRTASAGHAPVLTIGRDVVGVQLPTAAELRQQIDQQLKQPVRDGAAEFAAALPAQTPVPLPADSLVALLNLFASVPGAPVSVQADALEAMLSSLDQTQLSANAVVEAVNAALMVDPTTTLAALEQLDLEAYLGRLSAALTPEQLSTSAQVLVTYLQDDPLSGQIPARLIALLLAANPVPIDTLGLQPLVLVQIAGNLLLAASQLPDVPVEGLELDPVSVRKDLLDAVNPLLAVALGLDLAQPAALPGALEQALMALQAAAAAGVPSLLVPGVVVELPQA